MTEYILSIVGIVFLGVLVDVIMPNGEMNKYVKGVFSIIALFVIVSPVQKIFDSNYDLGDTFYDTTAVEIDTDFLEATQKQMKISFQNSIEAKLCDEGFEGVEVEILCEMSNYELVIKKVIADVSKMVMNENIEHINNYAEIKTIIAKNLNMEESDVVINE